MRLFRDDHSQRREGARACAHVFGTPLQVREGQGRSAKGEGRPHAVRTAQGGWMQRKYSS